MSSHHEGLGHALGRATLIAVICLTSCALVQAQTTSASVSGSVVDAQGGLVPGASVKLTSETQGTELETICDEKGSFFFPYVRPDTYVLTISLQGFQTTQKERVVVNANDRLMAGTFALQVGEINETVTVADDAAAIQLRSGERAYTLEEKDPYTSGHSERVCYYSDFISKRLLMPYKERNELQIASYLHDIGKIGISNRFINKKGSLNSADWAIIKQHTKKSVELLVPLKLSPNILSYIQYHHEHFDGTGYPNGLAGEQIPIGARIISISDSYDSMTSNRPYRKILSNGEAKSELLKCAGKQFDPNLISIFLEVLKEMEEVFLMKDHQNVLSLSY